MRERLTASFMLAALLLLAGVALVRGVTLGQALTAEESVDLHREVRLVAAALAEVHGDGRPVDEVLLTHLAPDASRLVFEDGDRLVAAGESFPDDAEILSSSTSVAGGELTLARQDVVPQLLTDDRGSLLVLVVATVVLAGLIGYLVARAMSAPFRQLADAAAALGRGRFELDLPRTRIPEAAAIAAALGSSAEQLQRTLERDRVFSEHASHALRTPLTGLRLELEDLAARHDLPDDARSGAGRGLARVEQVTQVVDELVALSRTGALVEGAAVPLRDLATQCVQRWADVLAPSDRRVTAALHGELESEYTPGPVEHVLDLLLGDVAARTGGPVRLVFDGGSGEHVRVQVTASRPASVQDPQGPGAERARAVVESLGGRLGGRLDGDDARLEVLLPRH